jgi:hypothetical protein
MLGVLSARWCRLAVAVVGAATVLAACSGGGSHPTAGPSAAGDGEIRGQLAAYGKATGGRTVPLSGTVTVAGTGVHRTVTIDRTGRYDLSLPPGLYTLTGSSPNFEHGAPAACHATGQVPVTAGKVIYAGVICLAETSNQSGGASPG